MTRDKSDAVFETAQLDDQRSRRFSSLMAISQVMSERQPVE